MQPENNLNSEQGYQAPQMPQAPQVPQPPQVSAAPVYGTVNQPVVGQQQVQNTHNTDIFGILSIVFAFLLSPLGIIFGIIGLVKAAKHKTSKALSIIGLVLSILITVFVTFVMVALVATTATGVAVKARDTKREVDVKSIANNLEVYYATNGYYPSITELQNNTWVTSNLKGLYPDNLVAPNAAGDNSISIASTITTYQYIALPAGCTTLAKNCKSFTLTAVREAEGSGSVTKQNLSN